MENLRQDKPLKLFAKWLLACSLLVVFSSCKKDDETPDPDGGSNASKTYEFWEKDYAGVTGTATISKNGDGSATVTLSLSGLPSGADMHPSHIHFNTAAEGGGIAVTLNSVDNTTGMSTTKVSMLDDDTPITYNELIDYDGYINVHFSTTDLASLVAQVDIGQNALTGEMMSYDLAEKDVAGISGTATFHERENGSTLVEVMLGGAVTGDHPMHIHENSAVEGGGIFVTLTSVDDAGWSSTQIDASTITYSDLIMYDGYINVHNSASDLATLVAQGDIGGNALTGTEKVYTLSEKDTPGISGTATFMERMNGNTLVELALTGTLSDEAPAHIHMNSASEGGGIALTFTPVDASTGMSWTHIEMLDDDTSIGYTDLLTYDGYINVHESSTNLTTIIAQGDIGSNAP